MTDSRNPKHCIWMHFETRWKFWRMSGSICNVCQGWRNIRWVYWPAISYPFPESSGFTGKKKFLAAISLLDANDHVMVAVKSLGQTQWHRISVFKIQVTNQISFSMDTVKLMLCIHIPFPSPSELTARLHFPPLPTLLESPLNSCQWNTGEMTSSPWPKSSPTIQ